DIDCQNGRANIVAVIGKVKNSLQAVEEDLSVWKACEVIREWILQQAFNGVLLFCDIIDGANTANDLAISANHRTRTNMKPMVMAILSANTEFVIKATFAVV